MYSYKSEDEMAHYPRPKFSLFLGVYCHYNTSRSHNGATNAVEEKSTLKPFLGQSSSITVF